MANNSRQTFSDLNGKAGADDATPEPSEGTAESGASDEQPEQEDGASDDPGEPAAPLTAQDVQKLIADALANANKDAKQAADEAAKLASMNDKERAEYERDQAMKRVAELERKAAVGEMMKVSRKQLADSGIKVSDEILSLIVNENADQTKAAVDSFSTLFKQELDNAIADKLKRQPPQAEQNQGSGISEAAKAALEYTSRYTPKKES